MKERGDKTNIIANIIEQILCVMYGEKCYIYIISFAYRFLSPLILQKNQLVDVTQ